MTSNLNNKKRGVSSQKTIKPIKRQSPIKTIGKQTDQVLTMSSKDLLEKQPNSKAKRNGLSNKNTNDKLKTNNRLTSQRIKTNVNSDCYN